jgi:hypothetical protein
VGLGNGHTYKTGSTKGGGVPSGLIGSAGALIRATTGDMRKKRKSREGPNQGLPLP